MEAVPFFRVGGISNRFREKFVYKIHNKTIAEFGIIYAKAVHGGEIAGTAMDIVSDPFAKMVENTHACF